MRTVLAALALTALLVACASTTSDPVGIDTGEAAPRSVVIGPTTAPGRTGTAVPPPAAGPAPASCVDSPGDADGAFDLTGTDLNAGGDPLDVAFTWDGQVPSTGSVLWVVWVTSADGETSRQLGYKIVDGQPSAQFVFDFASLQQDNLAGSAELGAQQLVAQFPRSAVDDLGEGWTWRAMLNVDGADVDECPPA